MEVSPSILGQSYTKKELQSLRKLCPRLHLDVMDGLFVKEKNSFSSKLLSSLPQFTLLEAHLMVKSPERYFARYKKAGVSVVDFHVEIGKTKERILLAKAKGLIPSLAISPKTPVSTLFPYLDLIDEVLLMGVTPGKSGQSFDKSTVKKITLLRKKKPALFIKVDGGISDSTMPLVLHADLVVSASYLFSENPVDQVKKLLKQK